MFSPEQKKMLEAPLQSNHVASRQQAGRALSYIEGWRAIAEANRIFGFGEWDRETLELHHLGTDRETDGKHRVGYRARVRITVRTPAGHVTRDGCGFGSGIDRDIDQAHESALKEAETDAMKRALMTFGNPFGLALYDKEQREVVDVDLNRLTEFEEAMSVAENLEQLDALVLEYTSDIVELRKKRKADWELLFNKVEARKAALATKEK